MAEANARIARVDAWLIPGLGRTIAITNASGTDWPADTYAHFGPLSESTGEVVPTIAAVTATVVGPVATVTLTEADVETIREAFPHTGFARCPWHIRTGSGAGEVAHATGFLGWDLTGSAQSATAVATVIVGPQGPTAVSADVGNAAELGTDGLIFVPPTAGSSVLSRLATLPSRVASAECMTGPTVNEAKTLVTLTGEGIVTSLWAVFNLPDAGGCRLQVFADGEESPSIDIEVSVLILSGLGAASQNPSINQGLGHLHVETIAAGYQSFTMLYPIPYSNGLVVKLYNPTGVSQSGGFMWCQAVSTPGVSPLRLRASSVALAAGATVASADAYQFVDLANKRGWMVYHAVLGTGSGRGWLERNINIYVDGEVSPSLPSTGLEDYFRSSNYFLTALGGGRSQYSTPVTTVTYISGSTCCVALDWLALSGGVKFDAGLKVVLATEQSNDGGATVNPFGWLILWYEDPPAPDTVLPIPGTLVVTAHSSTTITVVISGASDEAALHSLPYGFSSDNGSTWTAYQTSATHQFTGLEADTSYALTHRVKDAAGNVSVGSSGIVQATDAGDLAAPTVGTLAASSITSTGFTLTVSGASDETALNELPYSFTTDGGATWTTYQTANSIDVTGKTPSTAYTCGWKVRDASGNVSIGTEQTVTTVTTVDILSGATFHVAADSLTLADNDPVSTWTALNGNAPTAASTARPTFKTAVLNGKPSVRFDGTNDVMALTGLPTGKPGTFIAVVNVTKTVTAGVDCAMLLIGAVNTSLAWRFGTNTGAYKQNLDRAAAAVIGSSYATQATRDVPCIVAASYSTGGVWSFYRNNAADGSGTNNQEVTTGFTYLGADPNDATTWFGGDIFELAVFDSVLSSGDLSEVTRALGTKYGITVT